MRDFSWCVCVCVCVCVCALFMKVYRTHGNKHVQVEYAVQGCTFFSGVTHTFVIMIVHVHTHV